jgi:hypothetical protein
MKILNVVVFFFIFQIVSFSQSENMPVILVSSDSKIIYQDNSKINVIPGSIMNKKGSLLINPGGKAIVYHNYFFVEVSGDKSPVALDKLFVDDGSMVAKSELAFGEKLSDAVYNASISGVKMKNQQALVSGWGDKTGNSKDGWGDKTGNSKDGWGDKTGNSKDGWGDKTGNSKDGWGDKTGNSKDGWGDKTGNSKDGWGDKTGNSKDGWGDKTGNSKDGWGDKTGNSKDGWGKKDIKTRSSCPGGKYIEGLNKVSWEALKGTKTYTFVIEDMENNIVFTTQVKGTEYTIDTKAAMLLMDSTYAWYVHHPTKKEVSTPVFFNVVSKEWEAKALNPMKAADIYKKSNSDMQLLMEASQLEEEGFLLAAQTKYKEALVVSPKNSLAKMMYSLFCKNMNEIESATKALK